MAVHLVVTLGDPAGIGPEVTEAALARFLAAQPQVAITLVGPRNVAEAMAMRQGARVRVAGQADFRGPMAQASAASGAAALAALEAALSLIDAGGVHALVTAPISKHALSMAGSADLGHTEILARRLGAGPVAMAFFTERLKVVLATVHMPLRAIFSALTPARVLQVTRLLDAALRQMGHLRAPRLALAGLNPHAGESGLLGEEEQTVLLPAVEAARGEGLDLSLPIAPDTVFRRVAHGEYDGAVALYHDQGLIPVKLLSFGEAVNVTLGLRVVRTSPDHGTAYDRVGTHTASCEGMLAALHTALDMGSTHGGDGLVPTP